jgi:hypothetical protein
VRVGDTREQVTASLGQPLTLFYIVRRFNSIPETVSTLPADLSADISVREILNFSAGTRLARDFPLVEVQLPGIGMDTLAGVVPTIAWNSFRRQKGRAGDQQRRRTKLITATVNKISTLNVPTASGRHGASTRNIATTSR